MLTEFTFLAWIHIITIFTSHTKFLRVVCILDAIFSWSEVLWNDTPPHDRTVDRIKTSVTIILVVIKTTRSTKGFIRASSYYLDECYKKNNLNKFTPHY